MTGRTPSLSLRLVEAVVGGAGERPIPLGAGLGRWKSWKSNDGSFR